MCNDNIYALKKAIEAYIGISIMSANTVNGGVHQGTLARLWIWNINFTRPLALMKLKKTELSKALKMFE